jgi:hypothetical protein
MNPVGSAKGSVAGSCEPAGSGARELVLHRSILLLFVFFLFQANAFFLSDVLFLLSESSTGFMSYIAHITAWILQQQK